MPLPNTSRTHRTQAAFLAFLAAGAYAGRIGAVPPVGDAKTMRHETAMTPGVAQGSDAGRPIGTMTDSRRDDLADAAAAEPSHDAVVALANERGIVCTGTVVAARIVLTARHCTLLPIRAVHFGSDPRHPTLVLGVRATYAATDGVDVAALALDRDAPTAPLAIRAAEDPRPTVVRLVGFGATDARGVRGMGIRHYVDVSLRSFGCTHLDAARYGCTGAEITIPRSAGADTCAGDSGGPVLEMNEGKLRVVAVTSRAVNGSVLACGDGGIYTRTDRFGAWLALLNERIGER